MKFLTTALFIMAVTSIIIWVIYTALTIKSVTF